MNEEVSNKSVNLAVTTTKLTASAIYKGLNEYIRNQRTKAHYKQPKNKNIRGRQTVKQLMGQSEKVEKTELPEEHFKDFKKAARKYGIDYAVVRDKSTEPPRYVIFFKAKNMEAINHIHEKIGEKIVNQKDKKPTKPSIRDELRKLKEKIASLPKKFKKKEHVR